MLLKCYFRMWKLVFHKQIFSTLEYILQISFQIEFSICVKGGRGFDSNNRKLVNKTDGILWIFQYF